MRRTPRRFLPVLAVVALLPVCAASADVAVPVQHAIGYDPTAARAPGTRLPGGLHVPTGMRAVGGVFRRPDGPGWSAQLLVTGRPTAAIRSLLTEVRGIAPLGYADCSTMSLAWVYQPDLPAGLTARDLEFTECWVDAWTRHRGVEVGAMFDYGNSSLGPNPDGAPSPPVAVSAVTLTVNATAGRAGDPLPTSLPRIRIRRAHPLAPPATGEKTGTGLVNSPVRVLRGSRAVAAPLGGMGAFHQLLRVVGRPAVVFRRYVAVLRSRAGSKARASLFRGTSAYGRWRTAVIDSGADDRNGRLSMVSRGRRTYLDIWAD